MKKDELRESREESRRRNECNNGASPSNHARLSADGTMKHAFNVHLDVDEVAEESHLSITDQLVDADSSVHQQLRTTTSDVYQQLPKRPHWTFVVSGISRAVDQVISSIDLLCFY